jgi:hypothetical protein
MHVHSVTHNRARMATPTKSPDSSMYLPARVRKRNRYSLTGSRPWRRAGIVSAVWCHRCGPALGVSVSPPTQASAARLIPGLRREHRARTDNQMAADFAVLSIAAASAVLLVCGQSPIR